MMRVPNRPAQPVFLSTTAAWQRSGRERSARESEVLDRLGDRIAIRGLQGDIEFLEAESVVRSLAVIPSDRATRWLVIDLHRVTRLQPVAATILRALLGELIEHGMVLALAGPRDQVPGDGATGHFATLDEAVAWCEDALLAEAGAGPAPEEPPGS